MKTSRSACMWLLAPLGVVSTSAWALPAPVQVASLADMSLEELGAIEITSVSKRAQPLSEAAAAVFVITADDIRRSGATSLPEVLRLAPNLQVAKITNGRYAITARGFNGPEANKLLVLIDGRSVYTPLFAGVFWDAVHVMLQDVARIEVISGPGGTLWGVNAVNGIINVITRSAQDTQGDMVVAGAGNSEAGLSVRHGGQLTEDASYRVYAQRFNQNRTQLADGNDVDDGQQVRQAGFRVDWRHARDQLSLHGDVYRGDQGQPAPGTFFLPNVPLDLQHVRTQGLNMVGRWARKLDDDGELSVQGYFDRAERVVPITFNQQLDISDIQFQYATAPSGTQAWVLGGEYRMAQDRLINTTFLQFLPGQSTQDWSSLFVQDDISLKPNVHLVLGSRWESNDYTGVEWLPTARLAWTPSSDHLLWAAVSKTVRAPSRIDRESYVPTPTVFPYTLPLYSRYPYLIAGGAEVQSEVAKVFEVGYRGQPLPQTSISINVFRSLYDRLHTEEFGGAQEGLFTFAGKMKGAVSGIETWGSYQPLPTWRLSAGFTGLYERFQLEPGSRDKTNIAKNNGRDPAQTWQLRSSWDLPNGHEIDAAVRHVSHLHDPDVPSYTALDVRWGWRVKPGLALSLAGRNLLGNGHGEYLAEATRAEVQPSVYAQALINF